MNKITMWALGVCLLAIGILSIMYTVEKHTASKAKVDVAVYKEAATTLSDQLTTAHASFRFDLDAIEGAQKSKDQVQKRVVEVKEKVDAVSKKVKAGQISSNVADAAYLDSMWETYCERSSDPTCTKRSVDR